MEEQKDLLNDFEEKYKWSWHDELTFILFCIIVMPVYMIVWFVVFIKTKLNHPR